jgi:hypothetical protein
VLISEEESLELPSAAKLENYFTSNWRELDTFLEKLETLLSEFKAMRRNILSKLKSDLEKFHDEIL